MLAMPGSPSKSPSQSFFFFFVRGVLKKNPSSFKEDSFEGFLLREYYEFEYESECVKSACEREYKYKYEYECEYKYA